MESTCGSNQPVRALFRRAVLGGGSLIRRPHHRLPLEQGVRPRIHRGRAAVRQGTGPSETPVVRPGAPLGAKNKRGAPRRPARKRNPKTGQRAPATMTGNDKPAEPGERTIKVCALTSVWEWRWGRRSSPSGRSGILRLIRSAMLTWRRFLPRRLAPRAAEIGNRGAFWRFGTRHSSGNSRVVCRGILGASQGNGFSGPEDIPRATVQGRPPCISARTRITMRRRPCWYS